MNWAWRFNKKLTILLENIRFEHTVFALPFAYLGMILAARGVPTFWQLVWVTTAMAGARTFALSMNRLVDYVEDVKNPRTLGRPLPQGRLRRWEVFFFAAGGLALLFFSGWQLNELCVKLFPLAAVVLAGYTYVKRFSWLYHFAIGLGDGGAPVGGWIAVTGELAWEPVILGLAVTFWVAGFDLIYSCQDVKFDRTYGTKSIAARFGVAAALNTSSVSHAVTILLLAWLGFVMALGWLFWVGLFMAAALVTYEHSLVRPDDLSRLGVAFFNVNGYMAMIVFFFTLGGLFF